MTTFERQVLDESNSDQATALFQFTIAWPKGTAVDTLSEADKKIFLQRRLEEFVRHIYDFHHTQHVDSYRDHVSGDSIPTRIIMGSPGPIETDTREFA